jgi:murein L,D-transpeptidase YcbB/YkuD
MRKPAVLVGGLLLASALTGCSGDNAMARQQIVLMNEMAEALENVTDIPSLKEADAKLVALRQKLVRLQVQTKDWSEDRKNAIKERFKSELDAAVQRFQQAMEKAKSKADELGFPPPEGP